MFLPKFKPLSRRTLLRGAGAAMTLPWLEAMLPVGQRAHAEDPSRTPRLLIWIMTNGANMINWTVNGTGPNYTVANILDPIAALTNDITVVSGAHNGFLQPSGGHGPACGACLTGVQPTAGELRAGISFDQIVANQLGGQTPLRSLELATSRGTGVSADGYPAELNTRFSWADETTLLPTEVDPAKVFERIVGVAPGSGGGEVDQALAAREASVLDAVLESSNQLSSRLGAADRERLDQYQTYVREIEQRLQRDPVECTPGMSPPEGAVTGRDATKLADHIDLMHDMMLLAFTCDITRVITFLYDDSASILNYSPVVPEAPDAGYHNNVTHFSGYPIDGDNPPYAAINRFVLQFYADLVARLGEAQDPFGGRMLDSCAAVFCSEFGDASGHSTQNMPCLIAGSAGGRLVTGQHIALGSEPWANVAIALMRAMEVDIDSFGAEGTRPAPGLLV